MTGAGQEILVTGAAGFIGRTLVPELVRRGWRVRAFLHIEELSAPIVQGNVTILRGDVRHGADLQRAVTGVLAVVSLAARKMDEHDSEATNVGGARNLVAACQAAGVRRVINISTQSAKLPRPGVYGRTKRQADDVFETSGLDVTTLRPSLVYGADNSGAFETVRRFVERLPVVPILGDGRWISAPLHVGDVARAIADCLEEPTTTRRTYDLGGPDHLTFDDLVDRIAASLGCRRRKVHVPLALALPAVRGLKWIVPRAPISVSNVLGSNQDTAIDSGPGQRDFGFTARPLGEGLRELAAAAREQTLAREALRLGRYLLGVPPDEELRARYAAGVRRLFLDSEDASVRFARRLGWSLPLLDAALAVFGPDRQLRQRVLLMAAILEASTQHAGWYLRPPPDRGRLIAGLARRTLTSAFKMGLGLLLLPFVLRRDVTTR